MPFVTSSFLIFPCLAKPRPHLRTPSVLCSGSSTFLAQPPSSGCPFGCHSALQAAAAAAAVAARASTSWPSSAAALPALLCPLRPASSRSPRTAARRRRSGCCQTQVGSSDEGRAARCLPDGVAKKLGPQCSVLPCKHLSAFERCLAVQPGHLHVSVCACSFIPALSSPCRSPMLSLTCMCTTSHHHAPPVQAPSSARQRQSGRTAWRCPTARSSCGRAWASRRSSASPRCGPSAWRSTQVRGAVHYAAGCLVCWGRV